MKGVLYFIVGDKHANMLVCSLLSLREVYDGPVCIVSADDRSKAIAARCMQDRRLDVDLHIEWSPPEGKGKGHWHCAKTLLPTVTPFETTLFLDADTLVVGEIDDLWPKHPEIVHLTQFSTWQTTGSRIRKRIEGWREYLPREVTLMRAHSYPAINTGVMAWSRSSKRFCDEWARVAQQNVSFMGDELVAQLIFVNYPHMVFDHRFNFSPLYSLGEDMPRYQDADVRIVHFHGFSHCRPDKSTFGLTLWLPWYQKAIRENVAGVAEWTPASDKHLKRYLQAHPLPPLQGATC